MLQAFVNDVDNTYMHNYFKLAASTARTMRNDPSTSDRFIYTTHPWLMQRFLNCPCPEERAVHRAAGVYTNAAGDWRLYLSDLGGGKKFDLRCLTTNWKGGQPGGCGFDHGTCTAQKMTPFIGNLTNVPTR